MSREPFSAVLSDALVEAIRGRRVKVAVFLTFQFDPGFFEEELLPLLFDQSFSHIPQIRPAPIVCAHPTRSRKFLLRRSDAYPPSHPKCLLSLQTLQADQSESGN